VGEVTALRATRRGGVAVHVDGAYVCTVGEAAVARWRLHKGLELDDESLARLKAEASAERVLGDAYRLLGHRSRSRAELERRLLDRGHDPQVVYRTLTRLDDEGLLDDAAFARSYVTDKRGLAGWGSERIRRGLAAAGVAPEIADAALAGEEFREGDERERALEALARLGPPVPPLEAARRRAYQMLVRRGYPTTVAYAAVRTWSAQAPSEDAP
jgi:regulatory protein